MTFDDCKTPLAAAEKITREEWVCLPNNITTAIQHFCNRTLEQQRAGTVPHMADNVRQFMSMAGQPLPSKPGWPSDDVLKLRSDMITEEWWEYKEAIKRRDFVESVDGLIDLAYVVIGGLLDLGVDPTPLWREVHAANMRKLGGPIVNGKLKKPDGWRGPDIEARLREQGWEG